MAAAPSSGRVVIATVRSDVLVCQLQQRDGEWWLWPSGSAAPLPVMAEDGYRYFKAGIMLNDIQPESALPRMLFPTRDPEQSSRAMAAMDAINDRFGAGTIRPLATGLDRSAWTTRMRRLSPLYTTRIEEILEAKVW